MKKLLIFMNWLYLFGLSLWVSGMFFLGILAEIIVRIKLKEQPITASMVMNAFGTAFNVYVIKYICIAILIAEVVKWIAAKSGKFGYEPVRVTRWPYTKEVCLAVMMILAFYMTTVLRPEMHAIDKEKKEIQFKTLSKAQIDRIIQTGLDALNKAAEADNSTQAAKAIKTLNPAGELEVLREKTPGDQKLKIQFDEYHQRFEWLYFINMILGLTLITIHAKELTRFKDD